MPVEAQSSVSTQTDNLMQIRKTQLSFRSLTMIPTPHKTCSISVTKDIIGLVCIFRKYLEIKDIFENNNNYFAFILCRCNSLDKCDVNSLMKIPMSDD